jgi:hypothetical protein
MGEVQEDQELGVTGGGVRTIVVVVVAAAAAAAAVALVAEAGAGVAKDISTGFLERFLPRCMCFSQYLESG